MFNFSVRTNVHFGCGAVNSLIDILNAENWLNIGVVVDHNVAEQPRISKIIEDIKLYAGKCIIEKCSIAEPTYDSLEEARKIFNDPSLQVVIGIGGGSALDMAKAMAVLVNNKKPAIEYRGFDKMTEPVLPVIAIPTTAGTGSEVTPNASFIDSNEKKKMGINGEAVRPQHAFLDPELTLACPEKPTISAGIDSMVHAVEAFSAQKTNKIARMFAREGFSCVFHSLPLLLDDLDNLKLREEVMYGAFLAGIALMHSGPGPAAALSYPLGVRFGVPHGIGGGIFLPHVISHNIEQGYKEYDKLYNPEQLSKEEAVEFFKEKMLSVWKTIGVSQDLSEFGVRQEHIQIITDETMELKGALDQNPVPFYEDEIKKVLELMTGR